MGKFQLMEGSGGVGSALVTNYRRWTRGIGLCHELSAVNAKYQRLV